MRPDIVFIHGMRGNGSVWDCYRRYFEANGYSCRAPVLRFHDADPLSKPRTELGQIGLSQYVEDLSKELRSGGTKPIIIGHSMGGLLAQMLAERQLASAAVLLGPAPIADSMFINMSVLRCFRNIIKQWGFWRKPVRLTYEDSLHALFAKMDSERQRTLFSECVHESGKAIFEIGFSFLDRRKAARVTVENIRCPILIFVGKEDRITPAALVRKLARRYGEMATYMELENHSHWLIKEPGWEGIAAYIGYWLKEKGIAGAKNMRGLANEQSAAD